MNNTLPQTTTAVQDTLDAYRLGKQDARAGELCLPELYFTRREQRIAYCHGHVEVAGKTLLACQMLGWS